MKTKRANALIFVLGLIFAASIISVGIVEHTTRSLGFSASAIHSQSLRQDAYSALYATLAVLDEYAQIDGALYSAEQGWAKPLEEKRVEFPDGTAAEVVVSDESGKIPFNNLDSLALRKIFEGNGINSNTAKEAADCIVDWRDNDDSKSPDGAEFDDYDADSPKPPNRAILSFDELRFVEKARELFFDENGSPTPLYTLFAAATSTELFEKTNLNSASPETLKMMLDAEDKDYDDSLYRALRGEIGQVSDGIVWVKNSTELSARGAAEIPSKNADYKCGLLKIDITIRRGFARHKLTAYYAAKDTARYYETNVKKVYEQNESAKTGKRTDSSVGVVMPSVYTSKQSTISDGKNYVLIKIHENGQ